MEKFKETGDSQYSYQKKLDKTCYQLHIAYGNLKDLPSRTTSDKVLHDKAFNIAKNSKNDRYQKGLASIIYKLWIRSLLVLIRYEWMVKDLHYAKYIWRWWCQKWNYANQEVVENLKKEW